MVTPFSLKDTPALIERLLPVQKLSAEAYKEQMAGSGKTLTPLGSYWKGRKPLILNKACILGCLLPATDNVTRDLEIFEKLMAMDDESFAVRYKRRIKPKDILSSVSVANISDYFITDPEDILPTSSPIDWSIPDYASVRVYWRPEVTILERRRLEAQLLPRSTYRKRVDESYRAEELIASVHDHIWHEVNDHLRTNAYSFPELVEQLGLMRFGHRPKVADTFSGSGQIPFEAARLGCNVYASDLNPMACMLTWGAFNIIGGSEKSCEQLGESQDDLLRHVQFEVDKLGIETDGKGWRAKVYLYCVETCCPQTGWIVPMLPSLVISKPRTGDKINVIAELVPDQKNKRYDILIHSGVSEEEVTKATQGTVRSDGRGQDAYLIHTVNGIEYRTKISTIRGDYQKEDGMRSNNLRLWAKDEFKPQSDDIFQERLYCIQWTRPKELGRSEEYEFRAVSEEDLQREKVVNEFIANHLAEWQEKGWLPDLRIEHGSETERLYRERGWTYWHHLFNARQLLIAGLASQCKAAGTAFGLTQLINWNSRLCRWNIASGGGGSVQDTFYNQTFNTLFNYGCRAFSICYDLLKTGGRRFPLSTQISTVTKNHTVNELSEDADIFITDPPYGDAVKYEEILEFFIAWLRKNPPLEFAEWVWDSRRSLAIKGEDEDFRRDMVAAYKRMTECMPDNGIQVIMFTHQSGSIWADMANIVWASGLQVTAAWYVVTETDSALREGSYVKGTVLLVCRKRTGSLKTTRDDLAWEIQEEVEAQVQTLVGLIDEILTLNRKFHSIVSYPLLPRIECVG
jgi:putative DNA methylase